MSNTIIALKNIGYKYKSNTVALNNVNLNIPLGKRVALLGGNGAGKSTLMMLLNGILKPTSGCLEFQHTPYSYTKKRLFELRKNVGILFHEPDLQLIAPTVFEEISFGLINLGYNSTTVLNKVNETLISFNLSDLAHKSPHQLSSGQKKRVCLAAILAMEPNVIVCDEPTSSLDPHNSDIIFDALNQLNSIGKTIIISTHDVNQAYEWADFIVVMNNGEITISGTPEQVFANNDIIKQAGLKLPVIVDLCNFLGINSLPKNINELKKQLAFVPDFKTELTH